MLRSIAVTAWLAFLSSALAGCDLVYPEVAITNRTAETILIKNPSFRGCIWPVVLRYGDTTAPGRCLPGNDRVHFQRLNAAAYCQDRACDGTPPLDGGSEEPTDATPTWFNYQTITPRHVEHGSFHLFELTLDDMEQDFSVPGPYGH